MVTWLILIWASVAVLSIYPLTVALVEVVTVGDEPDTFDWCMVSTIATCAALLWPLAAIPATSWLAWGLIGARSATEVDA